MSQKMTYDEIGTVPMPPIARDIVAALTDGRMTPNQARATYGLPPLPGGPAPLLFDRLKAMLRDAAHPEARAIADAAGGTVGLDALACSALADWLSERGMETEAGRVRSLPVSDGDVLLLTHPHMYPPEARANLRRHADEIERRLASTGRKVTVICLPSNVDLKAVRVGAAGG